MFKLNSKLSGISLFATLVFGLLIILNVSCTKTTPGIEWVKGLEAGKEKAIEEKKPLMVYYSADWDEISEKFEIEVLRDSEVIASTRDMITVHLDSDVDGETAKKYGVNAYPTVIFYTNEGEEITRAVGYIEVAEMVKLLSDVKENKLETFNEMLAREEDNPDDLELAYEVGKYYLESTRIEKAITRFSTVIEMDPDNETSLVPSSMINLGFCSMINNDPEGAIYIFKNVIATYPGTAEERQAELYIGDCLRIMDDLEGALDQYKTVATNYPDTDEGKTASDNVAEMEAFGDTIKSLFGKEDEE